MNEIQKAAPEQIGRHNTTMPPLTDAMRAVIRNESDVYGSEDELYSALCEAAGQPVQDFCGRMAMIRVRDAVRNWKRGPYSAQEAMSVISVALAATLTPPAAPVPECEWFPASDMDEMPDIWEGGCGAAWTFTDGGPAENTMNFCPQCGGRVHIAASKQEVKS